MTLSWRPELSFYEARYSILRHLEETADMWAFRSGEAFAEARLIDRWHQLTLRPDSATLHLLAPGADASKTWNALTYAVETVRPRRPTSMSLAFQFVAPLNIPFDEAVARGHRRMLPSTETDGITLSDWAVLMDLKLKGHDAALGQTEFGIVQAAEVSSRLARQAGRTNLADAPTLMADQWAKERFPDVALFADLTFRTEATRDGPLDGLKGFWESARGQAGNLVESLKSTLESSDDKGKEVAS